MLKDVLITIPYRATIYFYHRFGTEKKEKEIRLESRVINFAALVRDSISWRQAG